MDQEMGNREMYLRLVGIICLTIIIGMGMFVGIKNEMNDPIPKLREKSWINGKCIICNHKMKDW